MACRGDPWHPRCYKGARERMPMTTIAYPARWRSLIASVVLLLAWLPDASPSPGQSPRHGKLSDEARRQAQNKGTTKLDVIVRFKRTPGAAETSLVRGFGGQVRRQNQRGWVSVSMPANALAGLANNPNVEFVAVDAPVSSST